MDEKNHRLIDDISNNLADYKESFQKMLRSIISQCDPNMRRHDSQLVDYVRDIIRVDYELKQNIARMREWSKRQRQIDSLEKELAHLSSRVNTFAKTVSKEQTELQSIVTKAEKLKKGIKDKNHISTIKNIIQTAKVIGPAASGARRNDITFPWMPDPYQMQVGVNAIETLNIPAPAVASHSISLDPVIMSRSAVIATMSSSSSYESTDDSD